MAKPGTLTILLLLYLFPLITLGQTEKDESLRFRSNDALRAGYGLYYEGRPIEAIDSFKHCLTLRKEFFGDRAYELGGPYMAIGIGYKELGMYDQSLKNYMLSEKNYLLKDDLNLNILARLYRNIANVHREKLDFVNSLTFNLRALDIFKSQREINPEDIYDVNYAIAEIYFMMNQTQKALDILLTGIDKTDLLNKIYYSELIAIIYQKIDDYPKANFYYKMNIDLVIDYYGAKSMQHANSLIIFAEFLAETKNFDHGIKILTQAYEIIKSNQPNKGIKLAEYYEYRGDLYKSKPVSTQNILSFRNQKKQNLQEALNFYHKSLQALYKGDDAVQIENLNIGNTLSFMDCLTLLKTVADTYTEMAMLDREEKSQAYVEGLDDALRYYEVIGNLIQTARKEISSDDSKRQLAELEYKSFTKTIETAFLAYEVEKADKYFEIAFQNSEQIKSSAVFDKISNDLAQENSLIPDSLIELENKLNSTISIFNEKIFEENSSEEPDSMLIEEYNNRIFEASRQRDDLNRFLEEEFPEYYELKYSNSMLSTNEIQRELDKHEALVEYVLSETDSVSELFTLLVTTGGKHFVRQKLTPVMQHSMEYMYNFMTSPNFLLTQEEDSRRFVAAAHEMYRLLIQPIEAQLANYELIIVPDGQLNYIAFDGLLNDLPDMSSNIDFSKLPYLIRDYNINYANSANIYFKHKGSGRNIKNQTLAFAPEYHAEKFEMSNASYTLLPLPGVQKEVDAISETVKTNVFRGSEANEQNFRENSGDFDILHLAMHAYINDSLPAFSRLAFSPMKDATDLNNDGWLNTADIYNLDLRKTRLTVLSACNTGTGKMQKGEGLLSLSRGFLYAGCPSIVMSLWEVEDRAGTQIMTSFYKNLKRGKTKDEALRRAKLSYLENANSRLAHPHYWMGFKTIGDKSPIYASYDVYFFGILIVLILLFSIDQWMRIKKARRKRQAS